MRRNTRYTARHSSISRDIAHRVRVFFRRKPTDWDVITFNFGLHDLALDNERIEPEVYTKYLVSIHVIV